MYTQDTETPTAAELAAGLAKVRSRRWLLWLAILIYLPGLLVALELQASSRTLTWLFAAWILLLCVVVGLATVVKCPRCGKAYHTHGPTFLPLRRCVHCQLPINFDKNKSSSSTD
ncbi:MAG: hypothetical protein P8Y91_07065 [Desulfuromonadales bacterium]